MNKIQNEFDKVIQDKNCLARFGHRGVIQEYHGEGTDKHPASGYSLE